MLTFLGWLLLLVLCWPLALLALLLWPLVWLNPRCRSGWSGLRSTRCSRSCVR